MKSIFSFLIILLSSFIVKANFTRDSVYTEICVDDGGDTTYYYSPNRYRITYDNNNRVIQSTVQINTNGVYTDLSRDSYSYDSAGRQIRDLHENYTNGNWQNETLDSAAYNNAGILILHSGYVYSGGWLPVPVRITRSVDNVDSVISVLVQDTTGNAWKNYTLEYHYRNIAHRDSVVYTFLWSGTAWDTVSSDIHFRNNAGNDSIVLHSSYNNGSWIIISRNKYTFDSQSRVINDTLESWGNGQWNLIQFEIFTRYQSGNDYSVEYFHWNNGLEHDSITSYSIDFNNHIHSIYSQTDWDSFYEAYTFSYDQQFDGNGNLILSDGDCIGCSPGDVSYYYDSNDYLIRRLVWHCDHGGDCWEDNCYYYYSQLSGNNIICDSGSVTLTADSCQSYAWSTGQTTRQIVVNSTGTYQVTCNYPNGMTIVSASFTVSVIPTVPPIHAVDSIFVHCNGTSDQLMGPGIPNSTYQWMRNDTILQNATGNAINFYPNGFHPGDYQLILTNGCGTDTSSVTHVISANRPVINIQPLQTAPYCSGDTITLTVQGNGLELYHWYPGNETHESIDVLTDGTYNVTAYDTNGCYDFDSYSITFTTSPPPITIIQSGNVLSIANVQGSIQWYYNLTPISNGTSVTATAAGVYIATLNNNGCISTAQYFFHPNIFTAEAGFNHSICEHDSVTLGNGNSTANYGVAPYNYSWSPPNSINNSSIASPHASPDSTTTYYLTITDHNGSVSIDSVTITVKPVPDATITSSTGIFDFCDFSSTNLSVPYDQNNTYNWYSNNIPQGGNYYYNIYSVGYYHVTVTGNNGCKSYSDTVHANLLPSPAVPAINVAGLPAQCGGTGSYLFTNYVPGLNYQWLDASGNAIAGQTDTIFYPSTANNYILRVIASNQCSMLGYAPFIEPDTTLNLSPINATDSNFCASSSVTLTTGYNSFYSYTWYMGSYAIPASDTNVYSATSSGWYTVQVSDTNGCHGRSSFNIYNIYPPDTLQIIYSGIDLIATGQIQNLQWYLNGQPILGATNVTYHPVQAGNYTVRNSVYSSGGNCNTMSLQIPVNCAVTPHSTLVSCNQTCNGTINLNINSANTTFVNWSNNQNGANLTQLCIGQYVFHVTDSAGCNVSDTINILQDHLSIVPSLYNWNHCATDCYSAIDLDISGGDSSYSVFVNGIPSASQYISNLCSGVYIINIDDSSGCTASDTFLITSPQMQNNFISGIATCNNICDAVVQSNVLGGMLPYTYNWNNGTHLSHVTTCPGLVIMTVTDGYGCVLTDSVIVTSASTLNLQGLPSATHCGGCSDGQIAVNYSGGSQPYSSVSWTPSIGTISNDTIRNLPAGSYVVCIHDAPGCEMCDTVIVLDDPLFTDINQSGTIVQIYPNPFNQTAVLKINNTNKYSLTVTDVSGRICFLQNDISATYTINRSGLERGIYFLRLENENEKIELKIILE
jgi:hypothetical protein